MKLLKNGTAIPLISLAGLLAVIGLELYLHCAYLTAPPSYTSQEIADPEIQPINLNTAAQQELSILSPLNGKQIKSILKYREEHGGFTTPEELLNVPDVGSSTYQEILMYITVE